MIVLRLFFLCCIVSLPVCLFAQPATVNPKPFVIPALQSWQGSQGSFVLGNKTRLVANTAQQKQLLPVANLFARDLAATTQFKPVVSPLTPKAGDIYMQLLTNDTTLGAEGYTISIDEFITIKANTTKGIVWGTRTLLQILEQDITHTHIPKGRIKDVPQYAVRGFVLDAGRKFFPLQFLRDYVKLMSYYKMNDFHIHLNDNGFKDFFGNNWDSTYAAFRLESSTYPGLTAKDGSYTKKEFKALQEEARLYGVNIIPEIDVPAHSLAFTRLFPEIGSKQYGMDHLDLENPKTYEVIDNVFKEYLQGPDPVFSGETVHIGTDEYAKKEAEQFRKFTDHYIRLVESYGKKVRLWGALTHAAGSTPVKSEGVTMNAWYNGYADPKEMIAQGYDLISTPDGWLYIVPAAGYYYDYLNLKKLYREWTPNMIGNQTFDPKHPQVKGGAFAVWNDHPGNGITAKDVHHRAFPAMQVLAHKMWAGADTVLKYDQFHQQADRIGEGPLLNVMGRYRLKDALLLDYDFTKASTQQTVNKLVKNKATINKNGLNLTGGTSYIQTPFTGIGYDYTVSFTIKADAGNKAGTTIFSSDDAVVKLMQQQTGKLGFSREGYDYYFNYTVQPGVWTKIVITGNHKGTSLYVNGQLVEKLEGAVKTFPNIDKKNAKVQTLFFPLQYIGAKTNAFKGSIQKLQVFNKILSPQEITGL
ncbi:family 20 glycosylhydrolase [Terrimonas rubra]|uniref:Family 20 glycosylhydrolase n=1 Tax=Terrimonas rubra TaxID=1035890 RepID=A0ABW6AAM1_9BACT